ncbi:MAG: hypothetical protein Q8P67_24265 [archaeon]|nr:hypothetical protein [archaeon]
MTEGSVRRRARAGLDGFLEHSVDDVDVIRQPLPVREQQHLLPGRNPAHALKMRLQVSRRTFQVLEAKMVRSGRRHAIIGESRQSDTQLDGTHS